MKDAKRRLSAIMFTDVVGYSALSHRKESLALELLDEHRQILRPIFQNFHGREIKTIGDAFLTEFDSALEAVRCAIEIQRALRTRNEGTTHERRIAVRIGIHLGDVVSTEGDVYGDGVNVAARLLHLAHAGGIAFSESIRQQVGNQVSEPIHKAGKRKLKNIARPMEVFRIGFEPQGSLGDWKNRIRRWARALRSSRSLATSFGVLLAVLIARNWQWGSVPLDRERIAVLPMANLTGAGEETEFLADGLTEELIGALSRIPGARVLARSTMMQYKGKKKSVAEIGRELGAGLLLEGSISGEEKKFHVSVRLTDANTQEAVWSERFDGTVQDMYSIQQKISERVSREFAQADRIARGGAAGGRSPASIAPAPSPTLNQESYLVYLKGKFLINKRTEKDLKAGIEQLKRSLELEPRNASANAAIANALALLSYYGYLSPMQTVSEGGKYIDQALELDPASAEAWLARAEKQAYFDYDWQVAEGSYRRALASQPGHSTAHQWFGEFLVAVGRFDEARVEMKTALDLDPLSSLTHVGATIPDYYGGDFERAAAGLKRVTEMDPGFVVAHIWLGRSLTQLGKYDRAISEFKRALELSPGSELIRAHLGFAYARSGHPDQAREILQDFEKQSAKEYVSCYAFASVYAGLGNRDETIRFLKKCFDEHSDYLVHMNVDPVFKSYRTDPVFASLVAKLRMN